MPLATTPARTQHASSTVALVDQPAQRGVDRAEEAEEVDGRGQGAQDVGARLMEGHPVHGATFGTVGTVTLLVDLWIEGRLLPGYMRAVSKPSGA